VKHIYVYVNIDVIVVRHEIHAARMRGHEYRKEEWIQVIVYIVYFNKKHVRFSSDTIRLLIKCSDLHATI
jgi:hypothetical protein